MPLRGLALAVLIVPKIVLWPLFLYSFLKKRSVNLTAWIRKGRSKEEDKNAH